MADFKEIAIQDLYAEPYRHCFGCGPDNEQGWHIKSYWHGAEVLAHYTPRPEYTGGIPENLYGGLLAADLFSIAMAPLPLLLFTTLHRDFN